MHHRRAHRFRRLARFTCRRRAGSLLELHLRENDAGVLDGIKTSIFVDGTLDTSAQSSPSISVNDFPVLIGENAQVKGRLFRGLIDDVRIYNRALSVDEVRTLSKGGAAVVPSTTVAWKWPGT